MMTKFLSDKLQTITLSLVTILKGSISKITNPNNSATVGYAPTANMNNYQINGYSFSECPVISDYRHISIAKSNVDGTLHMEGANSQYPLVTGFYNKLTITQYTILNLQPGESSNYADNWALVYQNDGITARKFDNSEYLATLPSGEHFSKYILDLIEDNNVKLRGYINDKINSTFNSHTHSFAYNAGATPTTGTSNAPGSTIADIEQNSTLEADKSAVTAQECLLNDKAKPL